MRLNQTPVASHSVGRFVGQWCMIASRVPLFAIYRTGMATHAYVQVNDQAKLPLRTAGKIGHLTVSVSLSVWPYLKILARRDKLFGGVKVLNCGWESLSPGADFAILTRRSYQAAWPVTGSELA